MKVWSEFSSSHSSNISVIGSFREKQVPDEVFEMIKDFALGSWEERYGSLEEFNKHWADRFNIDLPYIGIFPEEFESGVDNSPSIEVQDGEVIVSHFRTNNIGGIIKLMLFAGASNVNVVNK